VDVIEAIHTRRSVRLYTSRSVEHDLIEEIIWDAAQAPPPHTGQTPWTFNVVEGVERISVYGDEALNYARLIFNTWVRGRSIK
jgi:nitroreductase